MLDAAGWKLMKAELHLRHWQRREWLQVTLPTCVHSPHPLLFIQQRVTPSSYTTSMKHSCCRVLNKSSSYSSWFVKNTMLNMSTTSGSNLCCLTALNIFHTDSSLSLLMWNFLPVYSSDWFITSTLTRLLQHDSSNSSVQTQTVEQSAHSYSTRSFCTAGELWDVFSFWWTNTVTSFTRVFMSVD